MNDPSWRRRALRFFSLTWLLAAKDLRLEWRTREMLTTVGLFAVLLALLASLALVSEVGAAESMAPGVLWLCVHVSSLFATGVVWRFEREAGGLTALRLAPVPPAALFAGKLLALFVLLTAVEGLVTPLVALLLHVELTPVLLPLGLLLLCGNVGIAAAGALFGLLAVQRSGKELLLASLLLPLQAPSLLLGVASTRALLEGAPLGMLTDSLLLLGLFAFGIVVAGLCLFEVLLEA